MTSKLHPYLAIDAPVVPPPVETGGAFCWTFDAKWVPYIASLLKTLIIPRTYTSEMDRATGEASILLASLITGGECIEGITEDENCITFSPAAPFIDWGPQDPFRDPDFIPPGYIAVPWLVVEPGSLLSGIPGLQVGDVLSGYLSAPVNVLEVGSSLANFRVNLSGEGVVELHFVNIPNGGLALITTDNDLLTLKVYELNRDLIAIPPELASEIIVEVKIVGTGTHHIDVILSPQFQDEAIPLLYGGGLRSVVLCGFDEMATLFNVRQNPSKPCKLEKTVDGVYWTEWADINKCVPIHVDSGGNIIINIGDVSFSLFGTNTSLDTSIDWDDDMKPRLKPGDPCVIQIECSPGQWIDWYDPRKCVPGALAQPTNGEPLLAGECREWDVVLSANQKWLIPVQVNSGDVIEITNASGAWNDGTLLWFCVSGQLYAAHACLADAAAESGDPITSLNHMRLIMNIDGVAWVDAYNATYVVQTGVSDGTVYLQANDGSLGDNSGSVSFHIAVCNHAESTFVHPFDFLASTQSWVSFDRVEHVGGCAADITPYASGSGWGVYRCPAMNATYANIQRLFAARAVSDVSATFNLNEDVADGSSYFLYLVVGGVETLVHQIDGPLAAGNHTLSASGTWADVTAVRVRLAMNSNTVNSRITSANVSGIGTDPF